MLLFTSVLYWYGLLKCTTWNCPSLIQSVVRCCIFSIKYNKIWYKTDFFYPKIISVAFKSWHFSDRAQMTRKAGSQWGTELSECNLFFIFRRSCILYSLPSKVLNQRWVHSQSSFKTQASNCTAHKNKGLQSVPAQDNSCISAAPACTPSTLPDTVAKNTKVWDEDHKPNSPILCRGLLIH